MIEYITIGERNIENSQELIHANENPDGMSFGKRGWCVWGLAYKNKCADENYCSKQKSNEQEETNVQVEANEQMKT